MSHQPQPPNTNPRASKKGANGMNSTNGADSASSTDSTSLVDSASSTDSTDSTIIPSLRLISGATNTSLLPPITVTTLSSSIGITVSINNIDTVALTRFMATSDASAATMVTKINTQVGAMVNSIKTLKTTVATLTTQYTALAKVVQNMNTQLVTVYSFLAKEQQDLAADLSGIATATVGPF